MRRAREIRPDACKGEPASMPTDMRRQWNPPKQPPGASPDPRTVRDVFRGGITSRRQRGGSARRASLRHGLGAWGRPAVETPQAVIRVSQMPLLIAGAPIAVANLSTGERLGRTQETLSRSGIRRRQQAEPLVFRPSSVGEYVGLEAVRLKGRFLVDRPLVRCYNRGSSIERSADEEEVWTTRATPPGGCGLRCQSRNPLRR